MRKGIWCVALALLCAGMATSTLAERLTVISHGAWDERLNLRVAPSRRAASLGRYCSGVGVEVLERSDEWARVRVQMGTDGATAEGFMMLRYLSEAEQTGACFMPLATLRTPQALCDGQGMPLLLPELPAGARAYVLAFAPPHAHVLTLDGATGYLPLDALTGTDQLPAEAEALLIERIATPAEGAVLVQRATAASAVVATLSGGVVLPGAYVLPGRQTALVHLGDGVCGALLPGAWTWTNGAFASAAYAVYQQRGQVVEVIGTMNDGRLILRRDGEVTLATADALSGAQPMDAQGAYYAYTTPLRGEIDDAQAVARAVEALVARGVTDGATGAVWTAEALAALKARVTRLVSVQYGDRMTQVSFRDAAGVQRAVVSLDPLSGRVVGTDDNG